MACLNYDFKRLEIQHEMKQKNQDSKAGNIMRDFKESLNSTNNTSHTVRTNKEDDSAFEMLAKLKQRLIQKSMKNNVLLHRKVIRLERGKKTITVSVLREENTMFDPNSTDRYSLHSDKYLIKLVLFENKRIDVTDPTRNADGTIIEAASITSRSLQSSQYHK